MTDERPFPDSLCHRCRYLRVNGNKRGSIFLSCSEPTMPKYLPQPVRACAVFEPSVRLATAADGPAIDALMKASARALSDGFYTAAQVPSFVAYVALLDPVLIADRTYFVIEDGGGALAACGGWSDRGKLFSGGGAGADDEARLVPGRDPARIRAMFVHPSQARRGLGRRLLDACEGAARAAGFTDAELMATAPGEPLYRACGYRAVEAVEVVLPDGVVIACTRMAKSW